MEKIKNSNCIAPEELKQLKKEKKQQLKIIDVRSREEYDELHIPGAIHIAIQQLEKDSNLLFNKTDRIITACGKGGGRSAQAAEKLKEAGFRHVSWLCGGTFGWYAK